MDLGNFDANTVEPFAGFELIPEGEYTVEITDTKTKTPKNGGASYLELTFTIIAGEKKGSTLFARLNLNHENGKTREIARGQLSAICRAIGVMRPRDSVELMNIPLEITVTVREYEGKKYNDIKNYRKRKSIVPKVAEQTRTAPPAVNDEQPW